VPSPHRALLRLAPLELFYFEEIVRQLCGDTSFNLPYWDYFTDAHLPPAFRLPATGTNVLAHQRSTWLNDGTGAINVEPRGMDEIAFAAFQNMFEWNPHDITHAQVGFDMVNFRTAALDPVFYAHHCNIDRYWDRWLQQGGGRANPTGAWASTPFNFQTVSGPKTPTAFDADTPTKMG
jgi:tyrosinase